MNYGISGFIKSIHNAPSCQLPISLTPKLHIVYTMVDFNQPSMFHKDTVQNCKSVKPVFLYESGQVNYAQNP